MTAAVHPGPCPKLGRIAVRQQAILGWYETDKCVNNTGSIPYTLERLMTTIA